MNNIELLAPAGDLEKLKVAIDYGADAVYFGGESFSLRAGAGNLSIVEIKEGVEYAHSKGKKAYMTMNIFAHNEDIDMLFNYIKSISHIPIDAFIVSDPGVFQIIKSIFINSEFHLSTQANMTNYMTAKFWYDQGIKRIVLARELTFDEVKRIKKEIPEDMDIEAFVQGAMCISYSGRCLLSNFMIERDANRGACAHPCRWQYNLVEEKRPGEYFPIEEDNRGTYIMNSRDLCMLEYIPELVESGITSFKIEGRMKSSFYVATVVWAYRKAIDTFMNDKANYIFDPNLMTELKKVSHREFTTGFYFDKPTNKDQNYLTSAYTRDYTFIGIVKEYNNETCVATIEQRNKMNVGEEIEVFGPYTDFFSQTIEKMENDKGEEIESAPHPQQIVKIKMKKPVKEGFILRKEK